MLLCEGIKRGKKFNVVYFNYVFLEVESFITC
jgi:hypothetical protein